MEAARAPLALVRQLVRMHAHVAHQGGIGNAGVLADLSQGEEIAAPGRRRRATPPATRRSAPAASDAAATATATATPGRRRAPAAPASRRRRILARPPTAADVLDLDLFEHRQRALRVTLLAAGAHRRDTPLIELLIALQGRHRDAGSLRYLGEREQLVIPPTLTFRFSHLGSPPPGRSDQI